jgi:Outer membrane lipoprotein-sorting protein
MGTLGLDIVRRLPEGGLQRPSTRAFDEEGTMIGTTALLAFVLAAPQGLGTQELGPGVKEVQDCVERNAPKTTARQEIVLARKQTRGDSLELHATLFWKRGDDDLSRVLVRVDGPPDERGTALLLIEREGRNDMFSYLPEYQKVRRITARSLSGSFFGTDLSYEDVEEFQRVADHAKIERLPDGNLDGRPTYVLVGYPAPDTGSAYKRVVSHFDRETCVLLHSELFSDGEKPVKEVRIAFEDVKKEGERWIPRKVTVADRENESETVLTVEKIELDVAIPDKTFTESELLRMGR